MLPRGVTWSTAASHACLFVSPTPDLPAREWLGSLFAQEALTSLERAALLSGQAPGAVADAGADRVFVFWGGGEDDTHGDLCEQADRGRAGDGVRQSRGELRVVCA